VNDDGRSRRVEWGLSRRSSKGQATVEFALLLPVVALLALAIGQVALVALDRVRVTHSAREGARVAAVGGSDAAVRSEVVAASRLAPDRISVAVRRTATNVEVTVRYVGITELPLVGVLVDDVGMVAVARMRRERPP
jgi:Flp pilus assembly protein TadG